MEVKHETFSYRQNKLQLKLLNQLVSYSYDKVATRNHGMWKTQNLEILFSVHQLFVKHFLESGLHYSSSCYHSKCLVCLDNNVENSFTVVLCYPGNITHKYNKICG